MAGVGIRAQTGEISTGTSVRTVLQILAAANQRVLVKEVSVSFKGMVPTDPPVLVRVLRQTSAGTMSSLSLAKNNPSDGEVLQTTAFHSATSEPTAGEVLMCEEVHPQTGFIWQATFGGDIVVPGGTRLGVEVTSVTNINCVARLVGEE